MITISRLKDGSYIVTKAAGTKQASEKLQALGYQVTSTANLEYAEDQAPRAHTAWLLGKFEVVA